MKVAPLITVAIVLCIAFPGPIQAKKKFCMGKNGNKYAVGNGYDDNEGEVCIRYKCVKKKKKVIMKEMKCNLSCTSTQSTLSSNGFKYHKTKLKNDITKMEVVQKISKSSCIQGFSFGFKGPEAWVDKGCRAKFRFSFCQSGIGTTSQPVTCPPVPTCPTVTTCPDKTCPSIPNCPTFPPKTTCPPNPACPANPTCPTLPEQTTCPEKTCPPIPTCPTKACPPIPTCPTNTCPPSPTCPTNGAIPTTTAITSGAELIHTDADYQYYKVPVPASSKMTSALIVTTCHKFGFTPQCYRADFADNNCVQAPSGSSNGQHPRGMSKMLCGTIHPQECASTLHMFWYMNQILNWSSGSACGATKAGGYCSYGKDYTSTSDLPYFAACLKPV